MSLVLFACVAVACLISGIGAESTTPAPDLCHLPGYDVSELKKQDYWVANVTGQPLACVDPANHGNCTFYMAFCHELRLPRNLNASNCHGAAVCQVGYVNKTQHSYSLGAYTESHRFYQNNDSTGFFMDVFGGSNTTVCTNGTSTRVKLECNKTALWTSKNLTNFISVLAVHDPLDFGCHYNVILQYNGACRHMTNHTSTPVNPTSTRGHMNHTSSHAHHNMSTSMNMTTHSMSPTTSTSSSSSTTHHGTTTESSPTPTKSSSSTKAPPTKSPTKPVPTATPTTTPPPHPHTNPHTHPTQPNHPTTARPTENPLKHKVSGLTAGLVIFVLISIALVLVLIGVIYFFLKRAGGLKYDRVHNINED